MKKTLITVGIVLLFTAFFMVIFHFTSGASNVNPQSSDFALGNPSDVNPQSSDFALGNPSDVSTENTTEISSETEEAQIPPSATQTPPFTSNDTQKLVFDSGIYTSDQSGVVKEAENTSLTVDEDESYSENIGSDSELAEASPPPSTDRGVEEFDLKEYIKEKIVPVVVGVLTSASALLATLAAIKRSLSSIGETKEAFKKESKDREESFQKESELLAKKAEELEQVASLVPKLQEEISVLEKNTQALIGECANLGKMISLGFSQDERVVSSGNGKKISKLLKSCQSLLPNTTEPDEGDKDSAEAEEEAQERALI